MRPCFAEYRSTSTIISRNGKNAAKARPASSHSGMMASRMAHAAVNPIPMMEIMRPATTHGVIGGLTFTWPMIIAPPAWVYLGGVSSGLTPAVPSRPSRVMPDAVPRPLGRWSVRLTGPVRHRQDAATTQPGDTYDRTHHPATAHVRRAAHRGGRAAAVRVVDVRA